MSHFDRDAKTTLSRRAVLAGSVPLLAMPYVAGAQGTPAPFATPIAPNPEAVPGGILRLGVQGDPTELDPALVVLDAASLVIDFVYEALLHEGPDLIPQPRLATDWTISDDGLNYTFNLRPGVTFHNGRALEAGDVKYSIERVMNPDTGSPWASYAEAIAAIETPDDATVVITLSHPDATILSSLGRRGFSIVPQEEVERNGDLRQVMVGTGAFRFVEYIPNSVVQLEKNPEYWLEGRPYLDGLEVQIIPNDTARWTALVSDTVDMIEAAPHKDIEQFRATPEVDLVGGESTNLRWIVFNVRREPFSDKAFRRAVAEGIVRKQMIDAAVFGLGEPLFGVYPQDYWAAWQGEVPEGDPAAAAAALADIAMPANFVPGILSWAQYDFLMATSTVLQEQLTQMGIQSEIEPEENATYLERHFTGDFDIAVMGAGGYIDPNDFLGQTLGTGGVTNAAGYSNPDMDALLQAGVEETDQEKRREIYVQIQELIIEDAPWIMLYTSDSYTGVRNRVHGFVPYRSGSLDGVRETWIAE